MRKQESALTVDYDKYLLMPATRGCEVTAMAIVSIFIKYFYISIFNSKDYI